MMFNAYFKNMLVISSRSFLWVQKTGLPSENNRPVTNHWPTL